MLSFFSGRRGPNGPDLPSPFGRKFHFCIHFCLMMEEASLETFPKNNMIRDMINSDNIKQLQIKRKETILTNKRYYDMKSLTLRPLAIAEPLGHLTSDERPSKTFRKLATGTSPLWLYSSMCSEKQEIIIIISL